MTAYICIAMLSVVCLLLDWQVARLRKRVDALDAYTEVLGDNCLNLSRDLYGADER